MSLFLCVQIAVSQNLKTRKSAPNVSSAGLPALSTDERAVSVVCILGRPHQGEAAFSEAYVNRGLTANGSTQSSVLGCC